MFMIADGKGRKRTARTMAGLEPFCQETLVPFSVDNLGSIARESQIHASARDRHFSLAVALIPDGCRACQLSSESPGIVGLDDQLGSGRPRVIDDAAVLVATLQTPREHRGSTRWAANW